MSPAGSHTKSVLSTFRKMELGNPYLLVRIARKGVKPQVFYDFAGVINMSEKSLAAIINLSARTLSNYHEQRKALEPVFSEHLLKLIYLYEKGETVFGNLSEFSYWLKKPFWNSDESPMDWIVTPGGVDLVIKEIDRLAEGYPV
jgi:putative toxin-antitoxin system antitoxin component (TIGR02293 family)